MRTKKEIRESLNKDLIKKQGLNENQISVIVDLHYGKEEIFEELGKYLLPKYNYCHPKPKELMDQVTEIEFLLQAAWGFPQDKAFHKFWLLPGCICPYDDNEDLYPSKYYWRSKECPLHGKPLQG